MSALDGLLDKLAGVKKQGAGFLARCPAHDDNVRSLSVNVGDDDRVLVKCHAGCELDAIVSAVGLTAADLFEKRAAREPSRVVAEYAYRDEAGAVLYVVERKANPKKFVHKRQLPNGTWLYVRPMDGVRRVPYRLPQLVEGIAAGRWVLIPEGEKDVERLEAGGFVATCNSAGAGKWRPDLAPMFAGAKVAVIPDNDDTGRKHAEQVAASLASVAADVRIVTLDDVPEKGDVSDWFARGHDEAELRELVKVAPTWAEGAALAAGPEKQPAPPWESLSGLLDEIHELLTRHVAWPSPAAADAVATWVAHAHLVRLGTFDSTPRAAFLSPEKGSGKTRALEVLALLVPNPLHAVNVSAAAMFRVVEKQQPTLLLDEADSYLGPRVSAEHEDVRGLVNAGHRRGATALRCVGDGGKMDVKEFSAFCAVALAGIGFLPDTIMQRSVIIAMKRRRPDEIIQPFRARVVEPTAHAVRDRLAAWCEAHAKRVDQMDVDLPVSDRAGDVWEALITIGDAAGDQWSRRVRAACIALSEAGVEREASLGVRLLTDVRRVFDGLDVDGGTHADKLHTERLLERLNGLEDAPWGDLRGRELDARRLAKMLHAYDVSPAAQRIGEKVAKGYDRDGFYDAWQRYLPPAGSVTSGTTDTSVAHVTDVTHPQGGEAVNGCAVACDPGGKGSELLDPSDPDYGLKLARANAAEVRRRRTESNGHASVSAVDFSEPRR